ncbi:pectinesterase-like [Zingiber officinale]|uniref:pectinesterase-like n=1 Tax=Zingiber officinale TaxID=94328 RepID=UPI001C4DAF6F|nr:pectinesterase-like [Zingiber officinale]
MLSDVVPRSVALNPSIACNSTLDPKFCITFLTRPRDCSLHDYGRFSLAKSLSNARMFLDLVDLYLARRSTLSPTAVMALQDCRLLSSLNIDFLTTASVTVNYTDTLLGHQAEKLQTLLSALVTNQKTCSDGLKAVPISDGLAVPISDCTKLYSMSLALFNKAWVMPNKTNRGNRSASEVTPHRRGLLFHEALVDGDRRLPLWISGSKRELLERWRRRTQRLPQAGTDTILVHNIVLVSQDGKGDYTSITAAVNSAPSNLDGTTAGYYLIFVAAGIYQEYVVVGQRKTYLMMIGEGINQTVVTGNHNVADGRTTFNSATFAVVGQGFVAMNMTFRNTAGPAKGQAVAVRNGADLSAFYLCSFEGYQDTLYAHSMRQFYRECDIYGTVDYIFGDAAAVFQRCNVYSRLPLHGQGNTITAQGRSDPNQNTGTSMQSCRFLAAADLKAAGHSTRTYLGRPWRLYSRTVIMESFIDALVDPAGWLPWNGSFALATLYYAEFRNSGPGAGTASRVKWPGFHVIRSGDADNFTASKFIQGDNWLSLAGVPYDRGLKL